MSDRMRRRSRGQGRFAAAMTAYPAGRRQTSLCHFEEGPFVGLDVFSSWMGYYISRPWPSFAADQQYPPDCFTPSSTFPEVRIPCIFSRLPIHRSPGSFAPSSHRLHSAPWSLLRPPTPCVLSSTPVSHHSRLIFESRYAPYHRSGSHWLLPVYPYSSYLSSHNLPFRPLPFLLPSPSPRLSVPSRLFWSSSDPFLPSVSTLELGRLPVPVGAGTGGGVGVGGTRDTEWQTMIRMTRRERLC